MGRNGSRADGNNERDGKRTTSGSASQHSDSADAVTRRDPVDSLHGTVGNRAVEQLYEQGQLQATLKLGRSDDEREREAESVASEVVGASDADEDVRPPDAAESEPTVRVVRARESAGTELSDSDERAVESALSGGRPLSQSTREYFEPRFGRDFSDVRVHTDSQAAAAARSIDAEAFTLGTDIAFATGKYRPSTDEGKQLLAHELTHVVQGGGAVRRQPNAMISGGGGGAREGSALDDGAGGRELSGDQEAIDVSDEEGVQFSFPNVDELSTAEKLRLLNQLQMATGPTPSPMDGMLAGTLLSLYATSQLLGYTAAAGVTGSLVPLGGGVGASVGLVFFPSGQIGVYGTGRVEGTLAALSAEASLEYTVMYGGRETFSGTAYGWHTGVDLVVSGGGTVLTRSLEASEVIGVSAELGVGVGATLLEVAVSQEETVVYTGTGGESSETGGGSAGTGRRTDSTVN